MKIEIDVEDIDVLESYSGKDGHRDWGRMSWLYPGDIVAQISGKTAEIIKEAIQKEIHERTSKTN